MGVFDQQTQTRLAVPDPRTDHKLPGPRSLSFQQITKHAALTGTKGQNCNVVHGDHWHEVKGSEIHRVKVDQETTVSKNQKIHVGGDHKETLAGRCDQNIIGPHVVFNQTIRNETRMGRFLLIYGEHEEGHNDDGDWISEGFHTEHIGDCNAIHDKDMFTYNLAISAGLLQIGFDLAEIFCTIAHLEVMIASGELHFVHVEAHCPVHVEVHPSLPTIPCPS